MNSHLRASIAGLVYQLVIAITAFILTPVLLSGLGSHLFGAWALLNVVRAYASLSDLGIPGAIVMFAGGDRDRVDSDRVVTAGLLASLITTIGAVAIFLAAGSLILPLFKLPEALLPATRTAYTLMLLSSVPLVMARNLAAALGALQRYDIQMAADSAMVIVYNVLLLWAIRRGDGILGVAAVALLVSGLQAATMAAAFMRVKPGFRPRLGLPRQQLLRLARYSLTGQWADLCLALSDPLLKSLTAAGSGAAAVGALQVGAPLAMIPSAVVTSMSVNLFPAVVARYTAGDSAGISKLVRRYLLFIGCLLIPASLLLVAASPLVISWWLHTTDPAMVMTTRILTACFGVRALALLAPWRVSSGMERPQHGSMAMLLHIICLGAGGGALLALSAYSYIGILCVFFLSYVAASAYLWRRLKVTLPAFFSTDGGTLLSSLWRVAVVSVVICGAAWCLAGVLPGRLPQLSVYLFALPVSYGLIVMVLPGAERRALLDLCGQLLERVRHR